MTKITPEKFKIAVKGGKLSKNEPVIGGSRGNVMIIASRLGCTYRAVYKFLEKYKWAKEMLEEESWNPYHIVETKLQNAAIIKEEGWAIRTMLLDHKKGRQMGYGREQNINLGGAERPLKLELEIKYGKDTDEVKPVDADSDK